MNRKAPRWRDGFVQLFDSIIPAWRSLTGRRGHGRKQPPRFRPSLLALEDRTLPSITFTLDSALSALTLSGTINSPLGSGNLNPQGAGSLTTAYSGTVTANYAPGTSITFTGGSITAANSGNWQPNVGGGSGSAPANYGATTSISFVSALAAVRNFVGSSTSGPLSLTTTGTDTYSFPSNQTVSITSGNLDYSYSASFFGSGSGTGSIAGNSATNQAGAGTLRTGSLTATATFPVKVTYMQTFSTSVGNITVNITIAGSLVGTAELTSTSLSSSLNPSVFGQPVTFTATVASTGTPTGTVTFLDSGTTLGTALLNASDRASLTTSDLYGGVHPITAVYSGDGTFGDSTSATFNETISQAVSSTSLTSSLNPSVFGQAVTFTATVGSAVGTPATGSVTFLNGTTTLGTGTLNGSSPDKATFTTTPTQLPVGTDLITAAYGGDTNFSGSNSSPRLAQVVIPGPTAQFAVTGPPDLTAGTPGTFTVTAEDMFGNPTPAYTGTVHFTTSDTNPAVVLPPDSTLTNGTGMFSITLATVGTQTITATDTVTSSIAGTATVSVIPATAAHSFTVSATPATTQASAPFTITVTARDAFGNVDTAYSGTVHFTSSDTNGFVQLPPDSTLTNGTGMFSVTLVTAGTQTVTAADTVDTFVTGTASVTVTPLQAFQLTLSTPSVITAGTPFTITVTASDFFGNVATGYSGTVHFSSTDTNAAVMLPPDSTLTNGVGTFSVTLATAGAQMLTATDSANSSLMGLTPLTVSPAAATSLVMSGLPSTTAENAETPFTVTAFDAFGNVATGYSGTVTFTSSDTAAVLPATQMFTAADMGSPSFTTVFKTLGPQTITVTDTVDPSLTSSQETTVIPSLVVTHFGVSAPATATAGDSFTITVTALDDTNDTVTGYSGTVHFSTSDTNGAVVLPPDSTLTNGTGMFSVTLATAGTQTITATDTSAGTITGSTSVTVNPGAASSFTVMGPSTTMAGTPFPISVTAFDIFGNVAASYSGTVHFSTSDMNAAVVLPPDSTLTSGTGAFEVTLATAGTQTITAADTSDSSITGNISVTVTPAAAATLMVAAPSTVTAGSAFSFTVTALDMFGNVATGYSGTVHFATSDMNASVLLPPDSTLSNGTGMFDMTLATAGAQTITATDTVASTITGNATVTVSAAATALILTAPATATAGTAFTVTVTAVDRFGNVAPSYSGTVHFTTSDGNAAVMLPADSTLTGGTGMFSVTLATAGAQTITATDTVNSSFTSSASVSVSPAAAETLTVSAPTTATAGSAFSVTVKAFDAFGNLATGYSGTVHFTTSDLNAAVVLPPDSTLTNGTGMFSVTLATAGTQTVTATDTGNSTITGSASVTVSPAAATAFTLTAPATATAGAPFTATVTAVDGFGNVAPSYSGTVHFTTSDQNAAVMLPADSTLTGGTGMFSVTLATAGTQTITATDTVNSSFTSSASVSVSPAAAKTLTVSAPATATAGSAFSVTVKTFDAFGNLATGYSGTVHFTTSDLNAAVVLPPDSTLTNGTGMFSVTLATAGTQAITATDTGNSTITGSASVTVSPAATTAFTLAAPATATAGSAFTVTVTAIDMFGNVATGYSGTVHFTTSDTNADVSLPPNSTLTGGTGMFSVSLATAGSQTITATDTVHSSVTGSTSVSVNAAAAATYTISAPATATAGMTFTITVTAHDSFGNVAAGYNGTADVTSSDPRANTPFDGTLTNGIGMFGVRMLTAGTQTITATDTTNSSIAGSTSVSVTAAAAASLSLTAPSAAFPGTPFQVSVTAFDMFGNVATGYSGTVHFSTSDTGAGVTLPPDSTLTNGTGMFSVTLGTNGTQTITATDTVNSSLTSTASVTVSAILATHFVVSLPTSATQGSPFSFMVTAETAGNTIATMYTGTVHFSGSDLSASLPGDFTFTSADAGTMTFSATLRTWNFQSITATDTVAGSITGSASTPVIPTAPITITVVSTADNNDGGTFLDPGGPDRMIDLRDAIELANADTFGTNTIEFNLGSGTQKIALTMGALPAFTNPVIVDATPPPSFPNQQVVIDGPGDGLDITGGNSTIHGDDHLAIDGFASGSGIVFETLGGDAVNGTFIGTDANSDPGVGNSIGITINNAASCTVGGAGGENIISGNLAQGIVITGSGATGNVVFADVIGTDINGTAPLANGSDGILIEGGASLNRVAGGFNLISGNGGDGVHISGTGTDHNLVLSAVIGTNVSGGAALGNYMAGVAIDMGASDNTIGATSGPSINLISGNGGAGVEIGVSTGDTATGGNVVDDNAIGTDLSGTKAIPNVNDGVLIQGGASDNTIGGTSGAINLIAGNTGWGVVIDGGGNTTSGNNQVDKNAIGTDVTGTVALANVMGGIEIMGGSAGDTIGGTTGGGAINLISGNTGTAQVLVDDVTNVLIAANAIGTSGTGEAAFASATGDGILIKDGASGTKIGVGGFNLISGNKGNGITITGSDGTVVEDSAIGTDAAGTVALGNANGIVIENGSTRTQIGATGSFDLISGNTGAGVLIQGASGNTVQSSAIGQDVSGTKAIPNMNGIVIDQGSTGNQIGVMMGTNIVSGNSNDGILIEANGNTVQGNVIGADVSGSNPLPNGAAGVEIAGNNNVVGSVYDSGTNTFPSGLNSLNIIAYNTTDGVLVDAGASGDAIHQNWIHGNGGLGIDLASGANGGVMAPTLTSVTFGASSTTITGSLTGMANTTYVIEFYVNGPYASPAAFPVFFATETTNAAGTVSFTATAGSNFGNAQFYSATATDPNGNTSEFSNSVTG